MAETLQQKEGNLNLDILINGIKLKDTIEVKKVRIEMEVNQITSASITIQENLVNDFENNPFTNSEDEDFIPGNEVEISLGYLDEIKKVFKGIIVSQRLKVKGNTSQLIITCQDKTINMTKGRFNGVFQNKTDSDAIKSIVSKYSLNFDIEDTSIEHPVMMQYNCSDWDYLLLRAEANNMLVNTYQNKLRIKKTDFSLAPKYEIKYSQFIINIDLQLECENLYNAYNMTSWNSKTQKVMTSECFIEDSLNQGNLSSEELSHTLINNSDSYSSASIQIDEMKICLESEANRASLTKIQGKITVPGNSKIIAGDIIKLSEFSARFNGNAFISKVSHLVKNGEWLTELIVGKSAKSQDDLNHREVGASGLLPSLRGTQIGTVKQMHEDPDTNYRVLVTLPTCTGTGQEEGVWARMALPYASEDAGFFFFPEVGDEVLLTFMNEDPRFPVIIGSLYSAKHKAKESLDENNQFKSISSKSGINIKFDDVDNILSIETPSNNTIILDDENEHVSIKDMHDNSIVMDESGITMRTPKDINLIADENINLIATSNLAMKAEADVTLEGLNINQSAQSSFKAEGSGSAELSASGSTTIKGALVMIN